MAASGRAQWPPRPAWPCGQAGSVPQGLGKEPPNCPLLSSPSGVDPVPLWSPGRGNPCPLGHPFLRLPCPPQPQGPLLGAVPCPALPRRPSGTPGPSLVFPLALDTARPRNNTHSPLCQKRQKLLTPFIGLADRLLHAILVLPKVACSRGTTDSMPGVLLALSPGIAGSPSRASSPLRCNPANHAHLARQTPCLSPPLLHGHLHWVQDGSEC